MQDEAIFNTIEEAILDIKAGKMVIVVDDENRENEGDFVMAARHATPEAINFMATHGRGLICAPISEEISEQFELNLMVGRNTDSYKTAFTISIDLIGDDVTTGISASDRSKTVKALINPNLNGSTFSRPGHIFPLKAQKGGVLRRAGHTEAAVDLSRLAGFEEAGVIVEIMNEDGSMARVPDLQKIAQKFDLKFITIQDLIAYRLGNDNLIQKEVAVNMPTDHGEFNLVAYTQKDSGDKHLALVKGEWEINEPVMVRVHSSCVTGDILHSKRCDCGDQLDNAMRMVQQEGKGVVLYMNQEGRGIGLINKLKAYKLQEEGLDTVEANKKLGFKVDARDYGVGAQILSDLNISKIRLITNNPKKRIGLSAYGLEIVENIPIEISPNPYNEKYLLTKRDKLGHDILKG